MHFKQVCILRAHVKYSSMFNELGRTSDVSSLKLCISKHAIMIQLCPLWLSAAPYSGRTVSCCGSYWPEGPAPMRMWTPMTSLTICWRGVGFRSRSTVLTHCKEFSPLARDVWSTQSHTDLNVFCAVIPSCWNVGTQSLSADLLSITWSLKCIRSCLVWKESITSVWRLTMSTWTSPGRTRPRLDLQTRLKLQTRTWTVLTPAECESEDRCFAGEMEKRHKK